MMFSRSLPVHAGFMPRWMLERVVSASAFSGDLRWMAATLAISALTALEAILERQLVRFARHTMARALRGARFAGASGTADSMVAAAGR
jgi:hypothetical protein